MKGKVYHFDVFDWSLSIVHTSRFCHHGSKISNFFLYSARLSLGRCISNIILVELIRSDPYPYIVWSTFWSINKLRNFFALISWRKGDWVGQIWKSDIHSIFKISNVFELFKIIDFARLTFTMIIFAWKKIY